MFKIIINNSPLNRFAQHIKLGEQNTYIKGSPLYMAPEILQKHRYTASADLWSIGVILYECLFGRAPYRSGSLRELLEKIINNTRIEIPKHCKISPETEDLLTRLLQSNPDERISFQDFFDHEFLDLLHHPSDENLEQAVSIVTRAVEEDTRQNYESAYHLYCEALQYFVPIVMSETDAIRRVALRNRTQTYLHRAEEIKRHILNQCNTNCDSSASASATQSKTKKSVTAALTPSLLYQQLRKFFYKCFIHIYFSINIIIVDSVSSSTSALKNALEIGREAELYVYEGKYQNALDNYKLSLGKLVPLLSNEPKGQRRDLLHQQV